MTGFTNEHPEMVAKHKLSDCVNQESTVLLVLMESRGLCTQLRSEIQQAETLFPGQAVDLKHRVSSCPLWS